MHDFTLFVVLSLFTDGFLPTQAENILPTLGEPAVKRERTTNIKLRAEFCNFCGKILSGVCRVKNSGKISTWFVYDPFPAAVQYSHCLYFHLVIN